MLSRDEILARKKQQEELIMKGFVNNKTTSSKEEQDELPFSELRIEEDIEIDIQKKTYCETDNIEKGGKPAAIGEIRVWSGVKHVKHADGWVVIPKSKKAYLLDSSGKKHEKHSDEHENFGEKYRDEEHTKPEPKQEETPKDKSKETDIHTSLNNIIGKNNMDVVKEGDELHIVSSVRGDDHTYLAINPKDKTFEDIDGVPDEADTGRGMDDDEDVSREGSSGAYSGVKQAYNNIVKELKKQGYKEA
jgi:hypothetical protein